MSCVILPTLGGQRLLWVLLGKTHTSVSFLTRLFLEMYGVRVLPYL